MSLDNDTIIEGNKLIAIFLGYKVGKLNSWLSGETPEEFSYKKDDNGQINEGRPVSKLKYHLSWEWQINAYSKFVNTYEDWVHEHIIDEPIKADRAQLAIFESAYNVSVKNNDKIDAFLTLVERIKWFNQINS